MATNKTLFSSAMATFGKDVQANYKKAQADARRTPLMIQGIARLRTIDPVPAGEKDVEIRKGVFRHSEWPNQMDLVFDLKIEGKVYEMHKKLKFESATELEKFHKAVDKVVAMTTGEASRFWDPDKQTDWLKENDFPAYASWYNGFECFRFGSPDDDESEARKAIEAEQNK